MAKCNQSTPLSFKGSGGLLTTVGRPCVRW